MTCTLKEQSVLKVVLRRMMEFKAVAPLVVFTRREFDEPVRSMIHKKCFEIAMSKGRIFGATLWHGDWFSLISLSGMGGKGSVDMTPQHSLSIPQFCAAHVVSSLVDVA